MGRIGEKLFRVALLITLFFGIFGFVVFPVHAFQNEPDGFRGLTWGTSIYTVAGKIEEQSQVGKTLSVVSFKDEKLKMGGAELSSIHYIFRDSWFFSVLVRAKKEENFEAVKRYLFGKYGPRNQPDKKAGFYEWKGEVTTIKLSYQPQSEEVYLGISSSKGVKAFAEEMKKSKEEEW